MEDRKDPQRLGRCRVRVFGYHDKDKNLIPTAQLPWASPVTPVNSASTRGIGETPVGPVPGTQPEGRATVTLWPAALEKYRASVYCRGRCAVPGNGWR